MDETDRDAEIAARHALGQSTQTIARELGLRLVEVIGRVRALDLDAKRSGQARPTERTDTASAAAGTKAVGAVPGGIAASALSDRAMPAAPRPAPLPRAPGSQDDDDDETEDLVRRSGCPRGWLVTEERFSALFTSRSGRFEDIVLKRHPSQRR
jgi:hypothetical protein